MTTEKTVSETDRSHLFRRGVSGNPAGRPRGARNRTTRLVEELLDGEAEVLTRKMVELAKSGDANALRWCLDRLAPRRREAPVQFDLPPVRSAADAVLAMEAVLVAVAAGDLTPGEASEISALIETNVKLREIANLEARLEALEKQYATLAA